MAGVSALLLAVFATVCLACGGNDSPTRPTAVTPVAAAPPRTLAASVVNTMSGAPVPSALVEVNGQHVQADSDGVVVLQAGGGGQVTVSAPGYLTRQTRIAWERSTPLSIDLIPEAAPFSLGFYRHLARGELDGPMGPLRVLGGSPSIYLQTRDLSPVMVTQLEQAARDVIPAFTGGRLSLAAWETGEDLRPDTDGWIVVELMPTMEAACGRARVGARAGHIWLNMERSCERTLRKTFAHELGHALGFWHVKQTASLMDPSYFYTGIPYVTDLERYHGAIAYRRSAGNTDIDVDPGSVVLIEAPGPAPVISCP